jgi:hypothetical protein
MEDCQMAGRHNCVPPIDTSKLGHGPREGLVMHPIPETDRVPPALLAHLRYVFTYYDPVEPGPPFLPDFEAVLAKGQPWWSAAPELEELGHRWLSRGTHPEMRRRGCKWLNLFPSRDMVRALRAVALSPDEPRPVRDQAVWALGYRQLQNRHDALFWSPEVIALADATLLDVAKLPNAKEELRELSVALRHCRSPEILALFADDPVHWSGSIECFADERLARAVMGKLPDISPEDIWRVARLVADTLGPEACGPLLDFAANAPFTDKQDALLAALAIDAPRAKPHVDALLASMSSRASFERRALWQEAHPGVLPTLQALRVARVTATLAPEARSEACRTASDLFASQASMALFAEGYLYTMWRRVAGRARDPQRVLALVEAHPSSLDEEGVLEPYLEALADNGRFRKMLSEARQRESGAVPAWLLATHGRPFLALAARSGDRSASPTGVAAQALALFLAGRPDLARRTLADEPPRPAIIPGTLALTTFPGPDETWRVEHEGETAAPLRALLGGLRGLLACAKGAPELADPDGFDLALLATFEKSLLRELSGATVFLVGEHRDREGLEKLLTDRGAQIAEGPFAGVDFFILGGTVPVELFAKLERQGARRIDDPRTAAVTP